MNVIYDLETDILNLVFQEGKIIESDEVEKDFIFDYDKDGNVISIEVVDASQKISFPLSIAYKINEKNKKIHAI